MAKRLQVLLDEREWRELQKAAKADHMTVAEWVRQAIRAQRAVTSVVDIDEMNEQIERGYRGQSES